MNDDRNITLIVLDTMYPLTIKSKDEFVYREAAKALNEKIKKYRTKFPQSDSIKWVVMAALETSIERTYLKDKNDTAPYIEGITSLVKDIDQYLKEK
ncbi:MAG: cell division protein ZapA [Bacteroidaceae bacterium]|nr:cell division protein ZapA [Bacteroidaceae bacterium]